MKLISVSNLTDRKSIKDDIYASLSVDGITKYTTKLTKTKWDEQFEISLEKAHEVEIVIREKDGALLGLLWFKLRDLEDDLSIRYPNRPRAIADTQDLLMDLEPSGQLALKLNFATLQRTVTHQDKVFRRNPVQKVYPRNGHLFNAKEFYQVLKCALCNEFLGLQGYQCDCCSYTIHPRCYERVITKCIPLDQIANLKDSNTGQLLKYKIPHRWETTTSIGPGWCCHCAYIFTPGKKILRCSECGKCSHKECSAVVPFFCGLAPEMADILVTAFEAHERKQREKEIEQEENTRIAIPVFEVSDLTNLALGTANEENPPPLTLPIDIDHVEPKFDPNAEIISPVLSKKSENVSIGLEDFHLIAVLGRGSFGKVMLSKDKITGELFAIKALKKDFIVQNDDVVSVLLEKKIFQMASASHHPFLLNLHSSFQTPGRVYFVMEYVSGGDLMCHIQEKKRFSQARTRFYACEVLLALQYLHQQSIVYR